MTNSCTAAGGPPAEEVQGRRPGQESTTSALLRERSRRATMTSVLDRMAATGGQFAERRADGSGWSAAIPAGMPPCEPPAR